MDSEHTINSDIGVTGDKETVPVEKPEEDVSKSSDNIEAEEAMFAAVHKLFNMRIGGTLPPRLTARSRSGCVFFFFFFFFLRNKFVISGYLLVRTGSTLYIQPLLSSLCR